LFAACRRKWKNREFTNTWTWNGNVFVKQLPDKGGNIVKVHNLDDVNSL